MNNLHIPSPTTSTPKNHQPSVQLSQNAVTISITDLHKLLKNQKNPIKDSIKVQAVADPSNIYAIEPTSVTHNPHSDDENITQNEFIANRNNNKIQREKNHYSGNSRKAHHKSQGEKIDNYRSSHRENGRHRQESREYRMPHQDIRYKHADKSRNYYENTYGDREKDRERRYRNHQKRDSYNYSPPRHNHHRNYSKGKSKSRHSLHHNQYYYDNFEPLNSQLGNNYYDPYRKYNPERAISQANLYRSKSEKRFRQPDQNQYLSYESDTVTLSDSEERRFTSESSISYSSEDSFGADSYYRELRAYELERDNRRHYHHHQRHQNTSYRSKSEKNLYKNRKFLENSKVTLKQLSKSNRKMELDYRDYIPSDRLERSQSRRSQRSHRNRKISQTPSIEVSINNNNQENDEIAKYFDSGITGTNYETTITTKCSNPENNNNKKNSECQECEETKHELDKQMLIRKFVDIMQKNIVEGSTSELDKQNLDDIDRKIAQSNSISGKKGAGGFSFEDAEMVVFDPNSPVDDDDGSSKKPQQTSDEITTKFFQKMLELRKAEDQTSYDNKRFSFQPKMEVYNPASSQTNNNGILSDGPSIISDQTINSGISNPFTNSVNNDNQILSLSFNHGISDISRVSSVTKNYHANIEETTPTRIISESKRRREKSNHRPLGSKNQLKIDVSNSALNVLNDNDNNNNDNNDNDLGSKQTIVAKEEATFEEAEILPPGMVIMDPSKLREKYGKPPLYVEKNASISKTKNLNEITQQNTILNGLRPEGSRPVSEILSDNNNNNFTNEPPKRNPSLLEQLQGFDDDKEFHEKMAKMGRKNSQRKKSKSKKKPSITENLKSKSSFLDTKNQNKTNNNEPNFSSTQSDWNIGQNIQLEQNTTNIENAAAPPVPLSSNNRISISRPQLKSSRSRIIDHSVPEIRDFYDFVGYENMKRFHYFDEDSDNSDLVSEYEDNNNNLDLTRGTQSVSVFEENPEICVLYKNRSSKYRNQKKGNVLTRAFSKSMSSLMKITRKQRDLFSDWLRATGMGLPSCNCTNPAVENDRALYASENDLNQNGQKAYDNPFLSRPEIENQNLIVPQQHNSTTSIEKSSKLRIPKSPMKGHNDNPLLTPNKHFVTAEDVPGVNPNLLNAMFATSLGQSDNFAKQFRKANRQQQMEGILNGHAK